MNNTIQNTGDNKPLSMDVPTQVQLDGWVDEALDLFRKGHATGRRFTAWEICLHIIATHGREYVIPHASRGAFVGVRELVRDKMVNDFMNDPVKPYEAIDGVAADGQSAIFWTPILPLVQIPAVAPVTITVSKVDTTQNQPLQLAANIVYTVGDFKFTD